MKNKTIIIDNNTISLKKLQRYMQVEMPELDVIGSFQTIEEGMPSIHKEDPKLVFVNIEHLNAETFLQLQQMRTAACSIIFITPRLMEENLKHLPRQLMDNVAEKKHGIQLKIEDNTRMVPINKIIRLEAQSNYTLVYLVDRPQPVLTSRTLKWYKNELNDQQFICPHQSHLVNRNFIEKMNTKNEKSIFLKDGTRIKMSRRKARELKMLVMRKN